MRLRSLRLASFRAHEETALELGPKVNLLYGPNGAGKTNVLEAAHYLCLTKSFLTSTDQHVVRRGRPFFEVEGTFEGARRASLHVKVVFVPGEGKRVFLNRAPLERLADLVGEAPVVVLSPADYVLTAGGPEERRRFLDATLSQAHPVYLDDLLKYRRALKQRNALLQQVRRGGHLAAGSLRAWDEELVALGARLIVRRRQFLDRFADFLAEAYRLLDAVGEEPTMEYQTVAGVDEAADAEAVAEGFRVTLARLRRREAERGRTLAGPHLDEVLFRLGGFEVRPYASQGQHRTVGLALRLATFLYLRDRLDEVPLLLLDDVFGTLDARRAAVVLDLLRSEAVGQSLLTASRPEAVAERVPLRDGEHRAFLVVHGEVTEALPAPPGEGVLEPASDQG
ncbi:MAG TPA: DNA replication and repair protein RecF [Rubricoccaceae bacterium]|nr:DNA replication and repair protein RecF [Rubricoccaceae bacterium]